MLTPAMAQEVWKSPERPSIDIAEGVRGSGSTPWPSLHARLTNKKYRDRGREHASRTTTMRMRAATSRRTSPLRQLPAPHVAHGPNNLTGARPQTLPRSNHCGQPMHRGTTSLPPYEVKASA